MTSLYEQGRAPGKNVECSPVQAFWKKSGRQKRPSPVLGNNFAAAGLVQILMKVYNLSCEHDHRFEGWFSSEEDFNTQLADRHIECPICDSHHITKLPSAPRLNLSGTQAPQPDARAKFEAALLEVARQVIANTEDVGERFAEEARRIHYDEAPERGIRGVATAAECEALAEEGIEVVTLPIPAALKQPLQ